TGRHMRGATGCYAYLSAWHRTCPETEGGGYGDGTHRHAARSGESGSRACPLGGRGGRPGEALMIWRPRHPRRWLFGVACAAVLLMGERGPAAGASPEDCRKFHQECTEATAAGYRDVGICNVERLECVADAGAGVPERSREARPESADDRER